MLRIIQNRSAAGAESYYSHSDYYREGQELAGQWGGKGAAKLGLEGMIEREEFKALCENRHPQTGDRLTPRTKNDRTVGYDFNFHVPKGVSLAYMLNQDDRILDAFRTSVEETMQEIEADAKTRVRMRGRDEERPTANLVWGQFVHFTARPVSGIPDPHLHAHCFVFNQTFDETEKRWKAAQFRDLKRDSPYYQAAFYARLAKRLRELGYPIARKGRQWELAGISPSLSKKFSRRTQQVEDHAADRGVQNATEKDKLGAKTREKKQQELTLPELRGVWRERLTPEDDAALASLRGVATAPLGIDPQAPQLAIDHAIGHCFERDSVVPKWRLLAEALQHGIGQILPEDVITRLDANGVICRKYEDRDLATTQAVLAEERAMLAYARNGRHQAKPLNPSWKIQRAWLNGGQQSAVQHVLTSPSKVIMVKGMAGTGKTSLMQEAVEGIQAGGREVFTFAPSAEASRNVLRSEGFENATTVAELIANESLQQSAKHQVLWIDECGLLGTRQLNQVFDIAERIDAHVVLSGDWRQHGSVERGAAMRLLEHEAGIRPAVVSEIQRQKGRYREAVSHLARGDVEAGFDMLDELGWIMELDDEERLAAIAREYADTLQSDGTAPLVISPTHVEGEQISDVIRDELKARGLIGEDDKIVPRLVPLNLTEAERADPAMYEPGLVVVFHQNAKGHRKGERIVIGEKLPDELAQLAKRFQVYRLCEMPIATGEMIRFTSNAKTKDGKHRLNNGATHRVADFTKAGDIRLDNGWLVSANHGFLSRGYVVTSHASQGKTVSKVLIAESSASLPAAGREQFYVSVSRAKHQAVVFTHDKTELRETVTRTSPRLSAVELVTAVTARQQVIRRRLAPGMTQSAPAASAPERELSYG